jgi:hypothetical protein
MRLFTALASLGFGLIAAAAPATAQLVAADRLPATVLDVLPPSARVRGVPGAMSVQPRECRSEPAGSIRRRIVNIAAQEWGFFGFRTAAPADDGDNDAPDDGRRRRPRLSPAEAARVAPSIAGYWAVTAEGSWIVARQNDRWNGPDGIAARWNAPWSAAFISWVMCEAGLGATAQFQRAIAHHAYIDQALRQRDGPASQAAFIAYDAGESAIEPGDLLCSSRRPMYRTLADRRRQMGVGARSHCDIVVKVDEPGQRVFAIGGNVRGVVSLKQLPASRVAGKALAAHTGNDERPMFAHLKLRAPSIDAHAFDTSPTLAASARLQSGGVSGSH